MKLFESGKIGKMTLKNRIIMSPMHIGSIVEPDGRISERGIKYFETRAKGGAGLLITGLVLVDGKLLPDPPMQWSDMMADKRLYMFRFNELAEAVHAYGAKMAIEISPGWGRNANFAVINEVGTVGPSPIPCFRDPKIMARELSTEEVEYLVKCFENSARMLRDAGIDAVEMHGHDAYLLDSFTDSLFNKRTDKYGGDLDGRLRFPREAVEAVKKGAGPDFPVIYRLAVTHVIEGSRGIDEGLEICRKLEAAGVDAIDVDCGVYEVPYWSIPPTTQPPGCIVHLAEMVKKVVKIPVISVGKLGYPELAESVLEEGKADFIALGRSLIADPEWPNKVRLGKAEEICPCLGDNEGCLGAHRKNHYLSCTVNPVAGREEELSVKPAGKSKSVLVIGGGAAGMEAAIIAAQRGHEVKLVEKDSVLGGKLIPAAVPEFKLDYKRFLDYLTRQVEKLQITVELGKKATPALVQKMKPDFTVIATGSSPIIPDIPGVRGKNVITAIDALLDQKQVGKSVVVIGGGLVGCETALHLAQIGKKVTIVEILDAIARDVFLTNQKHLLKLLAEANVRMLTGIKVLEIAEAFITIANHDKGRSIKADTVVLAAGMKPESSLFETIRDKIPEVYAIGDCVEPRKVTDAVREGFRMARVI